MPPTGPTPDEVIDAALSELIRDMKPDMNRLGLWDNGHERLISATAVQLRDAIAACSRIHILVHGWQPVAEDLVMQYRGQTPPLTAWDERLVVDGVRLNPEWDRLAAAIVSTSSDSVVFAFDWIEDAAVPLPGESVEKADLNAARLVTTLASVLPPQWREDGGQIHLFGHSAGARLVSVATNLMEPPPDHLTLSDGPERSFLQTIQTADQNFLVLGSAMDAGRLSIGRGPGQTFVDNYFSALGIPYGALTTTEGVLDVRLDPVGSPDPQGYSLDWYIRATEGGEPVGLAWSPLIGQAEPTAALYGQVWRLDSEARDDSLEFALAPEPPPARLPLWIAPSGLSTGSKEGPLVVGDGPALSMEGASTAIWTTTIDVARGDEALIFDYIFGEPNPDSVLIVWVEDRIRSISLPEEQDEMPATGPTTWQRAIVSLGNLGTGRKEVRVGIRNSSGTFRADAFANVSILQDPEVFGPDLCGTSILGSMMLASCGFFALDLQMRRRHRRGNQRGLGGREAVCRLRKRVACTDSFGN
jgi:hypothetical protein